MATQQTDPQYKLRMPPELRDKLKKASMDNHRSMNAEIVARLQESFERDSATSAVGRRDPGTMTIKEIVEDHQVTLKKYLETLEELRWEQALESLKGLGSDSGRDSDDEKDR